MSRKQEPEHNIQIGKSLGNNNQTYYYETSRKERDLSLPVGFAIVASVFVVLPFTMYILGAPMLPIFAVMIFAAGLTADVFSTKAGLNRGFSDYNLFYNLVNKGGKSRMRNNSFLIAASLFGLIRAGIMYFFWNDAFISLLIASLSLLGPLWNSIMLSFPNNMKRNE
jgi:Mn2+/Fe2+ NRAMP family transporter